MIVMEAWQRVNDRLITIIDFWPQSFRLCQTNRERQPQTRTSRSLFRRSCRLAVLIFWRKRSRRPGLPRNSCCYLVLWLQKPPKNSVVSSVDRDGCPKKKTRREHRPMELARKRENNGCFLNRTEPKETAHIYPNYLIHPRAEDKQRPFGFWDLLM